MELLACSLLGALTAAWLMGALIVTEDLQWSKIGLMQAVSVVLGSSMGLLVGSAIFATWLTGGLWFEVLFVSRGQEDIQDERPGSTVTVLGRSAEKQQETAAIVDQKLEAGRKDWWCCACMRIAYTFTFSLAWFGTATWILRSTGYEHLDDMHPSNSCPILDSFVLRSKTQYLWIIPFQNGTAISDFPEWCADLKQLEQDGLVVLGMHGVYHEWHEDGSAEFECCVDPASLMEEGLAVWKKAFNATPKHFAFPGGFGSAENAAFLQDTYGMYLRSLLNGLLHRVYHCDDSFCNDGKFMCSTPYLDVF